MNEFLLFLNELCSRFPVHVEIYYSKIMDWCIKVWKEGCASDYPNSPHEGDHAVLVEEQDLDMQLCFAKAHVALKEWLRENRGGY